MTEFILVLAVAVLLAFAADVFRKRHPLSTDEVVRLASKRRRTSQLAEYRFCSQPRPAAPAEKKAMNSAGEFVVVDVDFYEGPSRLAGLLKYKKHEWIVIAFISQKRVIRLWWNKGPDGTKVFPMLSPATVQSLVRSLKADAIAVLHNHPNSNPGRYVANSPSEADLRSAVYYHGMLVNIGSSLLEFICERGTPHLYYAGFNDGVIPIGPVVDQVNSANGRGILTNYRLRKELGRITAGDRLPGSTIP